MDHQLLEFNLTRTASLEGGPPAPSGAGTLVREVVISTEKPVRSGGGIARAAGAVLAPYLRNPVVMWAHNYGEPPVAKTTSLVVEPGIGISAKFEFPAPGVYPLADVVRGLWDGGFINAASIGFAPLEWEMVPDPESARMKDEGGRMRTEQVPVFTKWELYEFSLVAVPRDREALRRAMELAPATAGGLPAQLEVARREVERLVLETQNVASLRAGVRGGLVPAPSAPASLRPGSLGPSSDAGIRAGTFGEDERDALAAAVGSLPAIDLQRLLDGLKAVRGAYYA